MARYYDGDLLLKLKDESPYWHFDLYDLEAYLESVPTADVVEVKHGKWVAASDKPGVYIGLKCSLCGGRIKYSEKFNGNHLYCHKCGAKMDGDV